MADARASLESLKNNETKSKENRNIQGSLFFSSAVLTTSKADSV